MNTIYLTSGFFNSFHRVFDVPKGTCTCITVSSREDGSEQDVFEILASYGVNCVRIRVWNDPYDGEEHGYGGNCDAAAAAEMGARV